MKVKSGVTAWFARLDRAGADLGALATVALPDALLSAPDSLLAGFADDGWRRLAAAVARSDGVAATGVDEAAAPSPKVSPRIIRSAASVDARALARAPAPVASAEQPAAMPGSRASAGTPVAASSSSAETGDPHADFASRLGEAAADGIGDPPRPATDDTATALRWQPAPDTGLSRADLAAWAGMDDAPQPEQAAAGRRGLDPSGAWQNAPAGQALPAAAPGITRGPAPGANSTAQFAAVSSSTTTPHHLSTAGTASQLAQLVDLWHARDDAGAMSAATPAPSGPGDGTNPPPPTTAAQPPAALMALPRAARHANAFDTMTTDDSATGDDQRHLSELLEQVLVEAVERQGLTVEAS
ncbi:MAG: hypothetical protein HY020_18930 [Burkholderiales bacterium]|nr:hypothetical protein [Burkholderiales bacterium]